MKQAWLQDAPWTVVVEINRQLCAQKHAQHGPTSDGYGGTSKLWETRHRDAMTLGELAALCHDCHRRAPFLNFNGNTFVAVVRQAISFVKIPPPKLAALRSLVGHIVAGTATPEELQAFAKAVRELEAGDA